MAELGPGAMIGQVILKRATCLCAGKAGLGYPFLPRAWGFGYAAEACPPALDWLGMRAAAGQHG